MLPQSAVEHYRSQQRITAVIVANVRKQWEQMGGDWDASWRRIEPAVTRSLVVGQVVAAKQSEPYMADLLGEYEVQNDPVGQIDPTRFAGVTGSGVAISQILGSAVINARRAGNLEAGGRWLDTVTTTTLADTSRASTAVVMSMTSAVTGYTRMLNPPSCQRCVILAGVTYRWNDGFRRHPGCDCRHVPSVESMPVTPTTNPKAYFDSLDHAAQDITFGKAGAAAIREGADMGQVVNARSGMYRASDGFLRTRSGSRRVAGGRRLMPEAIFDQAKSRDEAIEMLRRNGFIIDRPTPRIGSAKRIIPTRAALPDELPSSALRFDSPKAEKKFGSTVKQLDELHRIEPGVLGQTRIIVGGKTSTKGGHFSPGARPPKPRRKRGGDRDEYVRKMREWRDAELVPEIRINDSDYGEELVTFLHEFGHRMDYRSSSGATVNFYTSTDKVAREVADRYSSPAVSAFQAAARKSAPLAQASSNFSSAFVQYFQSPHEVWARAYSQWAANKLGGPHRVALMATQKQARNGVPLYQWSDEEFEVIGPLVEGILRERGLL